MAPIAPSAAPDSSSLAAAVEQELAAAGKTGWRARQAIELAAKLESPLPGAAALSKELDRLMGELLAGVNMQTDELDDMHENVVPMRRRRA